MKECRFRVGDYVDIDIKLGKAVRKLISPEMKLLHIIFEANSVERWQVIYKDLDKQTGSWMVWIESRAGEVHRFEERQLINRPENLTSAMATISKGATAREILGLSKEPCVEPKRYRTVIFKEDSKDE